MEYIDYLSRTKIQLLRITKKLALFFLFSRRHLSINNQLS